MTYIRALQCVARIRSLCVNDMGRTICDRIAAELIADVPSHPGRTNLKAVYDQLRHDQALLGSKERRG